MYPLIRMCICTSQRPLRWTCRRKQSLLITHHDIFWITWLTIINHHQWVLILQGFLSPQVPSPSKQLGSWPMLALGLPMWCLQKNYPKMLKLNDLIILVDSVNYLTGASKSSVFWDTGNPQCTVNGRVPHHIHSFDSANHAANSYNVRAIKIRLYPKETDTQLRLDIQQPTTVPNC